MADSKEAVNYSGLRYTFKVNPNYVPPLEQYEVHLEMADSTEVLSYPEILAYLQTTGPGYETPSSLLLPTKSAGQEQAHSTHGDSIQPEQASIQPGSLVKKESEEVVGKLKEVVEVVEMPNMAIKNANEKGIFCCNGSDGTFKLDQRSSSAFIPDYKHADIQAFMEAVNAGDIQYAVGRLAPQDLKQITVVIKVNVREDHEDVATFFFGATAEFLDNPKKKYTAFAALDKPQAFELNGERGFFAYFCKTHRKYVRVGQHAIKWTSKNSWARWENSSLDDLMGHPKKVVMNYGQPPLNFSGLK